jgi:uncharacterized protein with gpF-like domain
MADVTLEDIKYAFKLKPEKIIKFFEGLGIEISENWEEAEKVIKKNAFTVAGVMRGDILMKYKDALAKYLKTDLTRKSFEKELLKSFEEAGWTSPAHEKSSRMDLIFDTNIQHHYMQGKLANALDHQDIRPYIQFFSIVDKNTTDECEELHLVVMEIGDKLLYKFYPPGHFRCRRGMRTLSKEQVESKGLKVKKGSAILHLQNQKGFQNKKGLQALVDMSKYPKKLAAKVEEYADVI